MVASLGGIRIVGFFPLAPDSSAPLSLSQLLNDTEDTEQFNLLPSALQEHTCALRTGQEALPSHGARSPQAIYHIPVAYFVLRSVSAEHGSLNSSHRAAGCPGL